VTFGAQSHVVLAKEEEEETKITSTLNEEPLELSFGNGNRFSNL
jgi:hypothetical protein